MQPGWPLILQVRNRGSHLWLLLFGACWHPFFLDTLSPPTNTRIWALWHLWQSAFSASLLYFLGLHFSQETVFHLSLTWFFPTEFKPLLAWLSFLPSQGWRDAVADSAAESVSPDPTQALSFPLPCQGFRVCFLFMCVSVSVTCVHGACGSQEGALDPLEPELGWATQCECGNWIWGCWADSKHSWRLSYFSSPSFIIFPFLRPPALQKFCVLRG